MTKASSWTFSIPLQTPSENQIQRWLRGNRWRYTSLKKDIAEWVVLAKMNHRIPVAEGRRDVMIVREYKSRYRLDDDNFRAGCKSLIDSLVLSELLIDDTDALMKARYKQEQILAGDPVTWVTLGGQSPSL